MNASSQDLPLRWFFLRVFRRISLKPFRVERGPHVLEKANRPDAACVMGFPGGECFIIIVLNGFPLDRKKTMNNTGPGDVWGETVVRGGRGNATELDAEKSGVAVEDYRVERRLCVVFLEPLVEGVEESILPRVRGLALKDVQGRLSVRAVRAGWGYRLGVLMQTRVRGKYTDCKFGDEPLEIAGQGLECGLASVMI